MVPRELVPNRSGWQKPLEEAFPGEGTVDQAGGKIPPEELKESRMDHPGKQTAHRYNHLIHERSPYLLQHAENPVDWYPWSEEAFRQARKEDKPIFLSIGYATCHWCHVMAHESFEDEDVAGLLNQFFVSIKVDREERPDIDQVYMSVCQALTGQGGWPLSIFMTPEGNPFFAGTYLPKDRRAGYDGFHRPSESHRPSLAERPGGKFSRAAGKSAAPCSRKPGMTQQRPGWTWEF